MFDAIYYPLEVRRREYWGLGVFLLQYFPLVRIGKLLHYDGIKMKNSLVVKIGDTSEAVHMPQCTPWSILLTAYYIS